MTTDSQIQKTSNETKTSDSTNSRRTEDKGNVARSLARDTSHMGRYLASIRSR